MKSKRVKKKDFLSFLFGLPSWVFNDIADTIYEKGHNKATFGVSIATLGTFSLLILGSLLDITKPLGSVISISTIRSFLIAAFSLILSGLLKILEAFSRGKSQRWLAFISNFLLIFGLVGFVFIVGTLLYMAFIIL
ncbi:MAG: hypothetical protein V1836_00035 [Candidatus Aenigmatarchaeota archaeon]